MKKISLTFIPFIIFFFYSGCTKDNDVSQPEKVQQKSGSVLFKIDKQNAPKSIVEITAILSREGYDTLKSSMNILTDSTAELTMSGIEIGTWHLKIDAKNSTGIIMYTGETNVEVKEGIMVQVNLTLESTGAGIGSVQIVVGWGKLPNWSDYSNNPVFHKIDIYSPYGVTCPKIIIDGSVFKMWYRNQGESGTSTIGYAISEDGINWTNPVNYPVLSPGTSGAWDSYAVTDGLVIKENNIYRMYYRGTDVHSGYAAIGFATSIDGINWEKYSDPILTPNGSETAIGPESILKVNGTYYLYYNMMNNGNTVVGLATSADGINWTKFSGNPVMYPTKSWEGTTTDYPSIIYEDNIFKMVYMLNYDGNGWAFGKATSTDGKNWVKSAANPFFKGTQTSGHWAENITIPSLIKYGNEYRVYYACYNYPNRIGFAKSARF